MSCDKKGDASTMSSVPSVIDLRDSPGHSELAPSVSRDFPEDIAITRSIDLRVSSRCLDLPLRCHCAEWLSSLSPAIGKLSMPLYISGVKMSSGRVALYFFGVIILFRICSKLSVKLDQSQFSCVNLRALRPSRSRVVGSRSRCKLGNNSSGDA